MIPMIMANNRQPIDFLFVFNRL